MKLFNKVAIVGTGLIGGSLGLAIKKKGLAKEVIGVSRHKKNLLIAIKNKAIDKGAQDLSIIKDADLVILATPVSTILKSAPRIAKIISSDCIVTDVGSTKQEIVSSLEKIFPKYIGAHPLAGSEKRGVSNSSPALFDRTLCILTPTRNTDNLSLNKIRKFWAHLGVRVVILSPEAHDKITSFVSHLPHIVAFSLISVVPGSCLRFASSGLKDTTRIAGSASELWSDIFLTNHKNIAKAIKLLQENLSQIDSAIRKKDRLALNRILKDAKKKRDSLA